MEKRKQETDLIDAQSATIPERRFFQTEARAQTGQDGRMIIGGYGAVFNQYTNMGWYAEVVNPGFFDGIKDDRCACLFNHKESIVLGRKKNDTLTLKTDATGLDYQSILPAHRADVYELVQGGYVYESSFSFTTLKATWEEVDRSLLAGVLSETDLDQLSYGGKVTVRRLEKGKELFDVSPVTYGAYEQTSADTRAAKLDYNEWRKQHPRTDETTPPDTDETPKPSLRMRLLEVLERQY